jgi:dTDP-4-amino-4,6-dideoxygalactose transaminase
MIRSVNDIKVISSNSINYALEKLDLTARSILLLIDSSDILIRTITDGDIRRLLLSGYKLEDTLENLPSQSFLSVDESASETSVVVLMRQNLINQIPVIDSLKRPIGIYFKDDLDPIVQLSVPHMGGFEMTYVDEAFNSNWIAPLGPNVDSFEDEFSNYLRGSYCAAVNSGTSAIHLALRLLDINYGDLVLCSSFTFVASANPILYQGAKPIFIDSEPQTWNMSPEALNLAIKSSIKLGNKPKAIIVAHLYGQSAKMQELIELSEYYDIPIIEDAAESLGSLYKGVASGTLGKFGIFSFNGNKIITTSGGGMLISKDFDLIERARFLSTQAKESLPYYEHNEVGYNYRMSNVLAGIGRGQLKVLDQRVSERRAINAYYQKTLVHESLQWMPEPKDDQSNRWLSVVSLNPKKTKVTPEYLVNALSKKNIEVRRVWKPMHLQPLFSECSYFLHKKQSFCDYIYQTSVCLPSASNMTRVQQDYVITETLQVLDT